jgi:hypothetical protein
MIHLSPFFAVSFALMCFMSTTASADIAKGQKWYVKNCKECHGDGSKGAALHTQDEWEELFGNSAKLLIKKHEGSKVELYFKSDEFKDRSKHIRDFLFEYGSDSGNVPAC